LTIVNAYAPFSTPEADTLDIFYDALEDHLTKYASTSQTVVCGDFNAHIAREQLLAHHHPCAVPAAEFLTSTTDASGHRLLALADSFHLRIHNFGERGTWQQHTTCHTQNGPGTVVDYVLSSNRSNQQVTGLRIRRPAFISDHSLVLATLAPPHPKKRPRHEAERKPPAHDHPEHTHTGPVTTTELEYRRIIGELQQIPHVPPLTTHRTYIRSEHLKALNRRAHTAFRRAGHITAEVRALRHQVHQRSREEQRTQDAQFIKTLQQRVKANDLHGAYASLRPWTRKARQSAHKRMCIGEARARIAQYKDLYQRDIKADWYPAVPRQPPPPTPGKTQHHTRTYYTDGAWNQGQMMGWSVYDTGTSQVRCGGATSPFASSTRAELLAIIATLQQNRGGHAVIYTDSLNCIVNFQRLRAIVAANFSNVADADLWRQVAREVGQVGGSSSGHGTHLHLVKVKGHAGIAGNEIAVQRLQYSRTDVALPSTRFDKPVKFVVSATM
jgi:ribonuclease HI